ncbi:glutamate carboxypeptidase [Penicillium capsulatum]|uniref:Glutamate carboxypeptidase n=1 Tax=Penicillium capsulatum TaxID=69766 RepID=A0A9W9IPK7_9EURO|nr:glutamate carboxypeptidase [Penicillium capsulatum]
MISGLGMAFDSTFPVFLHHPKQDLSHNPDVKLPFKFTSGFGVDAQTIGIYYSIIGVFGMLIQFICFPPLAKRYGVLNCFKIASLVLPAIYFITPFLVLVPEPARIPAVLLLMLAKLGGTTFGIPCCTILLTNSASSMSVLATLNGVGTSFSAIGRGLFPALIGAAFSWGLEMGSVAFAWWLLAALAALSVIPGYYIVEQEGPSRDEVEYEEPESGPNGYGATDPSRGATSN